MKTLLEDYKRKLETIELMITDNTNNGSIKNIERQTRLNTKASEYRSFIVEIGRAITRTQSELNVPEIIKNKLISMKHLYQEQWKRLSEIAKNGNLTLLIEQTESLKKTYAKIVMLEVLYSDSLKS